PDEPLSSDCHPLVLFLEDKPIGAIQVDDLKNQAAALRLVAIDPPFQGGGHGRAMLERAEQFVRKLGCDKAVVYATPEAAGFYQTAGYDEEDWDEMCMGGIVQMLKKLDWAVAPANPFCTVSATTVRATSRRNYQSA